MSSEAESNKISNNGLQKNETVAIEELRRLILNNGTLKLRTDDTFLLRFLHAEEFDVENAYKRLLVYYNLKKDHPHLFPELPLSKFNHIVADGIKGILVDMQDNGGRIIHFTRLGKIDTSKVEFNDLVQIDDLMYEATIDDPQVYPNGMCSIIDMNGYSWKLAKWLNPLNLRYSTKKMETIALKNLQIHVVNSSMLLNAAIAVIFPFLSQKTKDRIHFHGSNWDSLQKYVSPNCLPKEYGGTLEVDYTATMERLFKERSQAMESSILNHISDC